MFNFICALFTGFFSEIGLKVLKSKSGPAISKIIPIYPMAPTASFMNDGIGLPSGLR